jgi:hypothetical protein
LETEVVSVGAEACEKWREEGDTPRNRPVSPTGIEQLSATADPASNLRDSSPGDSAKAIALSPDSALDPDLTKIIDAWRVLPEPTRRAVLALIECTTGPPPLPAAEVDAAKPAGTSAKSPARARRDAKRREGQSR